MKNDTKKKSFIWTAWIFAAITIVVVFITNRMVPFMMDDLWYSTILSEDTNLSGVGDIFKAQIWHYNNWGGRSMTHSLLQLILLTGEVVADILNTLALVLLCIIVWWSSSKDKKAEIKVKASEYVLGLTVCSGLIIGLNANWKMSMFWESGAANYLYITSFILVFINCYLRELSEDETLTVFGGITFWIIPLGIICGWSNENMGPVAFLVTIATIVILKRRKKRVQLWMYLGSASALIGSGFCILAPGNFVRSAQDTSSEYGLVWKLFLRCYNEARASLEYLFPVLLLTVFSIILLKFVAQRKPDIREIILMVSGLLSWGAMVLSPHYPDRATFGTMLLLICAIVSMTRKVLSKEPLAMRGILVISGIIWLRGMYFMFEFISMSLGWIVA